jgi:hypothetical protein
MRTSREQPRQGVPDVSAALTVARWLWPEFERFGDGTFLRTEPPMTRRYLTLTLKALKAEGGDLLDTEAFINHTHVFDVFAHRADLKRAPWYNRRHPDFIVACRLGELMCEAWAAKLHQDFPREDFAVFCTRDDNPIVTFHKIRADGQLWMDVAHWPVPGAALLIRSRDGSTRGCDRAPGAEEEAAPGTAANFPRSVSGLGDLRATEATRRENAPGKRGRAPGGVMASDLPDRKAHQRAPRLRSGHCNEDRA